MMHYYQFKIGDYRAATTHLTNEEDLAYRRLLDMYYDTEEKISLDVAWVAKRIRVEAAIVRDVLNDMFVQQEDGFFHAKCDALINEYKKFAEAGKRGAAKRWPSKELTPPDSPPITPPIATTNHKPLTTNHKKNTTKVNTPHGVSVDTWEGFVAQRKLAKATLTQTVINSIQREADKAGWTLERALAETVTRGWRSFKADWVKDKPQPAQQKSFKQMDEERSKQRYNEMIGRTTRIIDISPEDFLEIN